MKFSSLPWRKLLIVALCSLVIGNSILTLVLYGLGRPEITAWTGHVMQATPSAASDLLMAVVLLIVGFSVIKSE